MLDFCGAHNIAAASRAQVQSSLPHLYQQLVRQQHRSGTHYFGRNLSGPGPAKANPSEQYARNALTPSTSLRWPNRLTSGRDSGEPMKLPL
jgi:hypothetical protein